MSSEEKTAIDILFEEFSSILAKLEKDEPSLKSAAENNFRKALLLASASLFEKEVCDLILNFCKGASSGNVTLISFVENKALKREYHKLFSWEKNNANTFLVSLETSFPRK